MLQLNKDNLAQLWEAEVTTGCHVGGGMLILFVFQPDLVTKSVISAGQHSGLCPKRAYQGNHLFISESTMCC